MWTRSQIKSVIASKNFAIVVTSLVSSASGAAGAFILLNKRNEAKWQEVFEQEMRAYRYFTDRRNKTGEFADPSDLVKQIDEPELEVEVVVDEDLGEALTEAIDILEKQDYRSYSKEESKTPQSQEEVIEVSHSIKQNIFDNRPQYDTNWVPADEAEKKENGKPYVIPTSEYMENKDRYAQLCLTYYEGDDTVANELDIPLVKYEETLGEDNLHFGRASGDPRVVYIRNDEEQEMYEVNLDTGEFAEEVAGFQHSEDYGPRRFKKDEY